MENLKEKLDSLIKKIRLEIVKKLPNIYSEVLSKIELVVEDGDEKEAMAYASLKDGVTKITISPKKFYEKVGNHDEGFQRQFLIYLIVHEASHFYLKHFSRGKFLREMYNINHEVLNILADVELNNIIFSQMSFISKIKDEFYNKDYTKEIINFLNEGGFCTPDRVSEIFGVDLTKTPKIVEKMLKELMKQKPPQGGGNSDGDNGEGDDSGESNETNNNNSSSKNKNGTGNIKTKKKPAFIIDESEMNEKSKIEKELEKQEKTFTPAKFQKEMQEQSKSAGKGSGGFELELPEMLEEVSISHLNFFINKKKMKDGKTVNSYTRPRPTLMNMGVVSQNGRFKKYAEIGVVLDTSGSVYNPDVQNRFISLISEIEKRLNLKCEIAVCDDGIREITTLKDLKIKRSVKGGGGTDLQEGVDYFEKNKKDLILIISDGFLFEPLKKSKTRRVFLIPNGWEKPDIIKNEIAFRF